MNKVTGKSSTKKLDKDQPKISAFFQKRSSESSSGSDPATKSSLAVFTSIKQLPGRSENGFIRQKANRLSSTSSEDCIPSTPLDSRRKTRKKTRGLPTAGSTNSVSTIDTSDSPGDIIPPTPQVPWQLRRSQRAICQELSANAQLVVDLDQAVITQDTSASPESLMIADSPKRPSKMSSYMSLSQNRMRQLRLQNLSSGHCLSKSKEKSLSSDEKDGENSDVARPDRKRDMSNMSRAESVSKRICARRTASLINRSSLALGSAAKSPDAITPNVVPTTENEPTKSNANPMNLLTIVDTESEIDASPTKLLSMSVNTIQCGEDADSFVEDIHLSTTSHLSVDQCNTVADVRVRGSSVAGVTLTHSTSHKSNECSSPVEPDEQIPDPGIQDGGGVTDHIKVTTLSQNVSTVSIPVSAEKMVNVVDELSDSFWDDDFPWPTSQQAKPTMVSEKPDHSVFVKDCKRHLVTSVTHDSVSRQLELLVVSERVRLQRRVLLRGFWSDTKVQIGNVINLLVDNLDEATTTVIIDDCNGALLVVEPDFLVSGTSIVGSLFCPRKTVLNEWFRGLEMGNVDMFLGNLVHQLFQSSVSAHSTGNDEATSATALTSLLEQLMVQGSMLTDRYVHRLQWSDERLRGELRPLVNQIETWSKRYMAVVDADHSSNQRLAGVGGNDKVEVMAVHDIEENIWSPRFGIKGKIDLTTEVRIGGRNGETKVIPLELKTGRPSFSAEHKGQVQLYSMVSADRRADPGEGLLLYIRDGRMQRVPANHRPDLIQLRNSVATGLARPLAELEPSHNPATATSSEKWKPKVFRRLSPLPNATVGSNICQRCPFLTTCAIYHQQVDGDQASQRPNFDTLAKQAVSHLVEADVAYFLRWVTLLFLEKHHTRLEGSHLWLATARKREEQGLCLSDMRLIPFPDSVTQPDERASLTLHRFARTSNHWNSERALHSVGLSVSQYVIISVEELRLLAVTMGTIQRLTDDYVDILLDKNLYTRPDLGDVMYRVDSYTSQMTDGVCFVNMALLMSADSHCSRLRQFVVALQPPVFRSALSKEIALKCRGLVRELNKQQMQAVFSVLMADDYMLISGFPGSGKSSTLVVLVQVLAALGHSVLIASHTHAAVDNLLLKLQRRGVSFVRLGKAARVDPALHALTEEHLLRDASTVEDVEKIFGAQVMASTCLGIRHNVLRSRDKFDFCVVDEATQILEPAALGPLFHCRRFVLVGDPHQLPPVVRNREALDGGMAESLFVRLDRPNVTKELSTQYRMNSEIVFLANHLSYGGALQCANEEVAGATLQLPHSQSPVAGGATWLSHLVSTKLSATVLFLNTDRIPTVEPDDRPTRLVNDVECRIVRTIVQTLLQAGVLPDQVGVISPFRDQVAYIRRNLALRDSGVCAAIEVNTVDQYQGRDKDVIVISFVKNDTSADGGGILSDKRRINVAITRARRKLVLVGSKLALSKHKPLAVLLDCLRSDQEIALLPGPTDDSFMSSVVEEEREGEGS